MSSLSKKKRCPNGTRKNKKTGECDKKILNQKTISKRCPNGTHRNKKTGNCEANKKKINIHNRSAMKKIQNFMLRTTQKRKLNFLKSVCSDSGVCIAFGQETQKIKDFFGDFNTFKYVTGIKQIGKKSSNGFVLEVQYSRENYNAHSILKNSLKETSDNLSYEFFVGQYINKKIRQFPCFLETYGLFVRDIPQVTNLQTDLTLLSDKSKSNEEIYKISCNQSDKLSILIQHISNAQTLGEKLHSPDFIINDLLFVLYQVYMPLMCLQNEFTHYDLHTDNVLIYEPVIGKYIHYHYYVDGNKISFKSKYIAKIIDYGRCFFYDDANNNSRNIHHKICQESSCNPDCGEEYGYGWLHNNGFNGGNYYIDSAKVNISHDLRLLYDITLQKNKIPSFALPQNPALHSLLYKVEYGIGINEPNNKRYGTMPNPDSGIPRHINNIEDAYIMLEALVKHSTIQKQNNKDYKYLTKLGDLYVYSEEDKPIKFVPKK